MNVREILQQDKSGMSIVSFRRHEHIKQGSLLEYYEGKNYSGKKKDLNLPLDSVKHNQSIVSGGQLDSARSRRSDSYLEEELRRIQVEAERKEKHLIVNRIC